MFGSRPSDRPWAFIRNRDWSSNRIQSVVNGHVLWIIDKTQLLYLYRL